MSELNDLPVLILAYNRFDKFYKCFNTLKDQGIKKIFISIDGPANDDDIISQKKIISYCKKNIYGLDIKIKYFEFNNGCRLGPLNCISWFFNLNKYGVILEDDVIISKSCLDSFNLLLEKYKQNNQFMTLTSFYEYLEDGKYTLNKVPLYSLPVWRSWGWASWSDKWFEHIEFQNKIKRYNMVQLYNLLPNEFKSYQTIQILKSCQLNLIDAWDYEFNFSHIVMKYRSLTLGGINSLNYGFDSNASHTFSEGLGGINFDSFYEREIDCTNIITLKNKQTKEILEKCGFNLSNRKSKLKKTKEKSILFFTSLIFKLRLVKRFFIKFLKNNY